mgnify:CR=1 FL=1
MAASKKFVQKEKLRFSQFSLMPKNPMTISDIVATNSAYTTNIVQPIIHKLSDLGLVEVDSIVFRKKSFARAFRIADNSKNVLSGMFLEEYQSFRQLFADSYLLAPLVESELKNPLSSQAEIERLEEILETAKKKLR